MDEKTMVNDILAGVKSDLTAYQTAISEAENISLRQAFQQIRNNDESFQFELFKIAQTKGYYIPAQKATITEINKQLDTLAIVIPELANNKLDFSIDLASEVFADKADNWTMQLKTIADILRNYTNA